MAAGSDQSSLRETDKKRRSRKSNVGPMTRSENMSRIHGKDTLPELRVRRSFWKAGLRYRLHDKQLPGKPDLVFPGRRTVVFVHGCFWHCHEGCRNFRIPKTRTEWWAAKLARNQERDLEARAQLLAAGWRVIVIWECEVLDQPLLDELANRIKLA
jgi:DNA mismatch endonuclease, patch repair protein